MLLRKYEADSEWVREEVGRKAMLTRAGGRTGCEETPELESRTDLWSGLGRARTAFRAQHTTKTTKRQVSSSIHAISCLENIKLSRTPVRHANKSVRGATAFKRRRRDAEHPPRHRCEHGCG